MTDKMTPERLEEIEAREKDATMGPWNAAGRYKESMYGHIRGPEDKNILNNERMGMSEPAVIFCAHSRADVPAMAAEIRRCWAEIEKLGKMVDWLAQATSNAAPTSVRQGKYYWIKAAEREVSE